MGSTFVKYGDHGFWSRDLFVEDWLGRLVREIDAITSAPDWLTEAREHWNGQAALHFNGCIDCQFDQILLDQDRCDLIVDLATRVSKHEDLNRSQIVTADLILRLLRNEMSTTADSPKDDLARG